MSIQRFHIISTKLTAIQVPFTTWWTKDTALHTFVFCQLLIGLPFTVFNTYVVYQLQIVGFVIGTDIHGQPCQTYCIVPWAGTELDLNSVLLYLNAIGFGVGGAVTLVLCAYSDFWSRKHLLVTIFIAAFGAFSIPVYWLQDFTAQDFQSLTALYIVFAVLTFILIALLNIYIPHCMRNNVTASKALRTNLADNNDKPPADERKNAKRTYGFKMSVFGQMASQVGGAVLLIIVIILSQTLPGTASTSAGLLITTVTGFITVVGSLGAYFGLPAIPSKPSSALRSKWSEPMVEFFRPFKDFISRKNMAALLVSYTVYTDSVFAVSSVIGQLFVAEIRPSTLEYSLYSLAQVLCIIVCQILFLLLKPRFRISLETWLIIGYALVLVIPVWGCIGLANVNFGFKMKWEFYVELFLVQLSQAFVNNAFRVLFSEMTPVSSEVRWFGMQLVLSCATVWVNYVASGPLQNGTHQLRFPLVLSLVFLVFAMLTEIARGLLPVLIADRQKWEAIDGIAGDKVEPSERGNNTPREDIEIGMDVKNSGSRSVSGGDA